jgi:hypothetical protein
MSDPISDAIKAATPKITVPTLPNVTATIPPIKPPEIPNVDLKALLPIQKDPELIIREQQAKVLNAKATAEEKLLTLEDEAIAKAKGLLKTLTIPVIKFPPKLPLLDPKVLQAIVIAKKVKLLEKLKQKLSRANLKRASKVYQYPLKPPPVPPVPKLNLPTIPNIPPR